MYDSGHFYTLSFCKKIPKTPNGVLILNEAGETCFDLRGKKKNKEIIGKSHQKFMEVTLLWTKTKTFFGSAIFPNIITKKWS